MILSILIPAYNEECTIQEIIKEIHRIDLSSVGISEKEVILIDDASTDKTKELAESTKLPLKIIHHTERLGKGASIASGISQVKGDIIIIQDADLEYSPEEYPALLKPIIDGEASVVYGSRFLYNARPQDMMLANYLANRIGTLLINLLYRSGLTDSMTCFKVFKISTIKGVKLTSKGFGIDVELTSIFSKRGDEIKEVPVPYKARTFKEGKKFHPLNSLGVLWAILKYKFTPI